MNSWACIIIIPITTCAGHSSCSSTDLECLPNSKEPFSFLVVTSALFQPMWMCIPCWVPLLNQHLFPKPQKNYPKSHGDFLKLGSWLPKLLLGVMTWCGASSASCRLCSNFTLTQRHDLQITTCTATMYGLYSVISVQHLLPSAARSWVILCIPSLMHDSTWISIL
jgi:hypothetical protein